MKIKSISPGKIFSSIWRHLQRWPEYTGNITAELWMPPALSEDAVLSEEEDGENAAEGSVLFYTYMYWFYI